MAEWKNHFLADLGPADLDLLRPRLELRELERDQVLTEPGHRIEAAYLPANCVISVIAVMRDGRAVETRTIGCESGMGLLHALGSPVAFEEVRCQIAGQAWRLPLAPLAAAAARSPSLVNTLARHAQATLLQTAQSTACNCLHTAEQRLCRWLLLTRERIGSDVLPLTQEHLSIMLGVQRTTITLVAKQLQAEGVVSYSRGRIVLKRIDVLMRRSCECYEAIEEAGRRILAD